MNTSERMTGMLTLQELKDEVGAGRIDTVLACQIDMQGRLMGKRFQAEYFLDHAWQETHSCNYLLATDMEMETVDGYQASGWDKGYGDYVMKPDLTTLRRAAWLEATALVLCDVLDHHDQEVSHSPRAILKKQIKLLAEMGLQANMASELEFFLFNNSFEQAQAGGYRDLQTSSAYNEDYHIFQTTKEESVMRAIRNGLQNSGIPVENSKGEACSGQEEINVRYADALTMADRHVIMKNACKEIAWQQGKALTFMAKWSDNHAGNSAHVHQSLSATDSGMPVFYDPQSSHSMSDTLRHYLAGLLHHSSDITCLLAPSINSYKRFAAGTFAPTRAIWSRDNRTAGYRLCAENSKAIRVECRIGGGDLNPYLAFAALLAAGMDGIRKQRVLEDEFTGNAYEHAGLREIPHTLRDATQALEGSSMLRDAFGDAVIDHYVHAARHEQFEYDRRVTDWEVNRGFERA